MFSDKRRIELSREDLQRELAGLVQAAEAGLPLRADLVPRQDIAEPLLTLFKKALEAEAAT